MNIDRLRNQFPEPIKVLLGDERPLKEHAIQAWKSDPLENNGSLNVIKDKTNSPVEITVDSKPGAMNIYLLSINGVKSPVAGADWTTKAANLIRSESTNNHLSGVWEPILIKKLCYQKWGKQKSFYVFVGVQLLTNS